MCIRDRRVIALVMAMDALLFALTAFLTAEPALLAVRVAVGFFAPISLSISWVADVSATKPPDIYRRNFAHVGLAFNLGSLLGAACGGLLGPGRWLVANLLSAAPCALTCAWALASSEPISALAQGASAAVRGVRETLAAFPFRVACAQYFMSGAILGSFYSLAPVLLARSHGAPAGARAAAPPPPRWRSAITSSRRSRAVDDAARALQSRDLKKIPPPPKKTKKNRPGAIAAVSLASAAWNILNNLLAIRPILAYLGALRAVALASAVAAVSNAALAVAQRDRIATFALYPLYYVSAALALTVLNMMSSAYAARFGENAVGTVNGIARAIFSSGFGVAPAVSVALWQWLPWSPFVLGAVGWVVAGSLTLYVARSGDPDPVPGKLSARREAALMGCVSPGAAAPAHAPPPADDATRGRAPAVARA